MSSKTSKITAGKAKERISSLEESISARQQRLEQLEARLQRTDTPQERLVSAKQRLERRLALEKEQVEKLYNLLERSSALPEESGEFFVSEEIDDLHRSFEEVRQNFAQIQARIDGQEIPRDLTGRLTSFEERVTRREEVASELFGQLLSLQTALDQERQAIRRLTRRIREQDQSLDALREAVEDSVVATVDLAERIEELEESVSESKEVSETTTQSDPEEKPWRSEMELLQEQVEDARRDLRALKDRIATAAATPSVEESPVASTPDLDGLVSRMELLERRLTEVVESSNRPSVATGESLTERTPARFAKNGASSGHQIAHFSSRAPGNTSPLCLP